MASRHTALLLLAAALLMLHTARCSSAHALATPAASSRLRLFTVFAPPATATNNSTSSSSSPAAAVLAMLAAAPVKQFASDFIVIGEPLDAHAQPHVDTYDATNSAQILYQRPRWKLLDEGSKHDVRLNGSIHTYHHIRWTILRHSLTLIIMSTRQAVPLTWARFAAIDDANATMCLAIAHWNASWNDGDAGSAVNRYAASLLASVNASCETHDVVALVLSSPATSSALATLDPNTTAAATVGESLQLTEASHLLHQQQYVSSSVSVVNVPSAASSRLFLRMRTTMCADRAATLSGINSGAVASTALALELCSGANCSICRPASFAATSTAGGSDAPSHAAKDNDRGDGSGTGGSSSSTSPSLVLVVACSLFLVASVPVVLVLFRHQFFAPDASTKEETELTADLARVLHI